MAAQTHAAVDATVNGAGPPTARLRRGAPGPQGAKLAEDLRETVERNAKLNLWVRALLAAIGLGAGAAAVVYTLRHGADLATLVDAKSTADLWRRLLALTMPVILLVALAGIAAATAWTTHSRGLDEFFRTIDCVNRVEREGEVAVSARGLIVAFEAKLQNAQRAFTLLLWIGRTTFVICLGLFTAAVIRAVLGDFDLATAILAGGSLLGAVVSFVRGAPQTITENLAAVIRIQSIITGCDRQISLLESDAFAALNNTTIPRAEAHAIAIEDQERIDAVVGTAVKRIKACVPDRR
jgi:hypothetical protein